MLYIEGRFKHVHVKGAGGRDVFCRPSVTLDESVTAFARGHCCQQKLRFAAAAAELVAVRRFYL